MSHKNVVTSVSSVRFREKEREQVREGRQGIKETSEYSEEQRGYAATIGVRAALLESVRETGSTSCIRDNKMYLRSGGFLIRL